MTSNKALFNKAAACVILLAFASCTLTLLQNSSVVTLAHQKQKENTADEISYSSPKKNSNNNNNPDDNFIDQTKPAAEEEPTSLSVKAAHYYANLNFTGKGDVHDIVPMPKNNFLLHFTQALKATYNTSMHTSVIHLVVRNMTLYYPRTLRKTVMNSTNGWMRRARAAVEMIQTGLDQKNHGEFEGSFLPIFVLIGDGCGCSTSDGFDTLKYPRLSWAFPSAKYSEGEYFGSSWCQSAIGIPSYEMWFSFHSHKNSSSWDATFAMYSEKYPWNSKLKKAMWRGTTTYEKRYMGVDLNETPRGKLVHLSLTNPGLIDAAFVKLIQQYEGQEDVLANQTILAGRMQFDDQMKYKAIIDIDGNNWSSRFAKLLCANSVVIKVRTFCSFSGSVHFYVLLSQTDTESAIIGCVG
jgi:hypothetical protein